jgi:hypothetical protein
MKYKILKSETQYSEVITVEYGSPYKSKATIRVTNGVATLTLSNNVHNVSDLAHLVELAKEIEEAHLPMQNALKDITSWL